MQSTNFMDVAKVESLESKDPSTQVGACVVDGCGNVIGKGFNKMPNGAEDKFPWSRDADREEDKKYFYVCHAELNAIINTGKTRLEGCTIYVTLFPCNECSKLIIQTGISKVIYWQKWKEPNDPKVKASEKLLSVAKIPTGQLKPTCDENL